MRLLGFSAGVRDKAAELLHLQAVVATLRLDQEKNRASHLENRRGESSRIHCRKRHGCFDSLAHTSTRACTTLGVQTSTRSLRSLDPLILPNAMLPASFSAAASCWSTSSATFNARLGSKHRHKAKTPSRLKRCAAPQGFSFKSLMLSMLSSMDVRSGFHLGRAKSEGPSHGPTHHAVPHTPRSKVLGIFGIGRSFGHLSHQTTKMTVVASVLVRATEGTYT